MSDIATTTDAKLMEGPAFVRTRPLAPLPPPITEAGAIGWLRKNLFSGALNIALTIVCALLIIWIVPPLVKFLIIDAVWDGTSRADCPARCVETRSQSSSRAARSRHAAPKGRS